MSPLWSDYWKALETLDLSIDKFRGCAEQALRDTQDLFSVAWAAHALLTCPDSIAAIMIGSDDFNDTHRLGALMMLEQVSDYFGDKAKSPFFPLLVRDAFERLQDDPNQECWMQLIESLLPDILGSKYTSIKDQLDGGNIDESTLSIIDQAVQGWMSKYQDDHYVHPIIWPEPAELEDFSAGLKSVPIEKLLEPLPSLDMPFPRPLPLPTLPLLGYTDDDVPLTRAESDQIMEYLHGELVWLTPTNLRLLLLPDDAESDLEATQNYREVLDLLQNQAFARPLAPNGQRQVLELLRHGEDGDRLFQEAHLTPQNLPQLVEHNPLVAHECLLRVLTSTNDDNIKNEFLSSLVGMDMNLHVMEVVNRLATQRILHPEYIHLFVNSCIACCENSTGHTQSRLVRLVCVFIQSLVRNEIIQVEDVYFEVQAFCVEFSRIREAAALYKSLKENN